MALLRVCSPRCQPGTDFADQEQMQKVAALRGLWAQVCLRESRARIRNRELLQSFSALESQLEDLSARTSALRRRKREYEEFLQHLKIDLQRSQGSDERQGWVSKNPLEHFMGPLSNNWNVHPFQTGDRREPMPRPSKGTMPSWATPGTFWSDKLSWGPSTAPSFHTKTTSSRSVRKHDNQDVSSLWSPWRSWKDRGSCFPSGQGSESLERRCHPQRSGMVGRPEDLLSKSLMDLNIMNGEELRSAARSVHNNRCAEEEPKEILVRRRKGHSLANHVEGVSQSSKLHREVPALQGRHGQPRRTSLSEDVPDASFASSLAEVDSEQEGDGRESKSSPRQQGMQAKHRDANISILSEELMQMPLDRSPRLRKDKKNVTVQGGTEKTEEPLGLEEQGDGDLGVDPGEEKAKSNENKNGDDGRPFGKEQSGDENEGFLGKEMEEDGTVERGSRRLLTEGPEQENMASDETMTKLEGLGWTGVEESGLLCTEPEIRMGNNLEKEWVQDAEGDALGEEEEGGTIGERDDGTTEAEGAQNGSCGKETGPEQDFGDHDQEEEDAASTSSGSVQIPLATVKLGIAKQDSVAGRRTPSLQNESPMEAKLAETGTESACEGEEGEEEKEESEETEADADIEAALAPDSFKSVSKHWQSETAVQRLQDLWADHAEEGKGGNLSDKDDFYD